MGARLYWFPISHPAQAVRAMLELKGIDYQLAGVLAGTQRVHLRLAGFRGGTVPALKLDGRRVQGSRTIARALDELRPAPPLFPADADARARVEEAERWGDEELQDMPRRLLRWDLTRHQELRRGLAEASGMPAPAVAGWLSAPVARCYARAVAAHEATVRRHLAELPRMLDHADALLADGVLATEPPNAATLQVLCSVRSLDAFADLHDEVARHPCAVVAREIFPAFPEPVPRFLPREWLGA